MTADGEEALVERAATLLREPPPPLAPDRARAWVIAAMQRASEEDGREDRLVDALADLLAEAPPPPETERPEALVLRAMRARAEGHAPEKPPTVRPVRIVSEPVVNEPVFVDSSIRAAQRRQWAFLAAAAVFLAVGIGLWADQLLRDPAPSSRTVHRLAAGHVITAGGDARLALDERGGRVRVTLEAGEALFDVVPGADVTVVAGAVQVRVTGTVFTVARSGAQVDVRVYEGSVEVRAGTVAQRLEAGQARVLGGREARPSGLEAEARRAAARRTRVALARDAAAASADSPGLQEATIVAEAVAPSGAAPGGGPPPGSLPSSGPAPSGPALIGPALIGPAMGASTPPSSDAPGAPIEVARRALVDGRYAEALALAEDALRARPSFEWQMVRGDALRGAGRAIDAVDAYTEAMAGASAAQRAIAGLSAARLLAERGDEARARTVLLESGALDPASPTAAAASRLAARLGPP